MRVTKEAELEQRMALHPEMPELKSEKLEVNRQTGLGERREPSCLWDVEGHRAERERCSGVNLDNKNEAGEQEREWLKKKRAGRR